MKKITLLLALLLTAIGFSQQNHYSFSKTTATYADLEGATSINNGQPWNEQVEFESHPLVFDAKVFSLPHQELFFYDGQIILFDSNLEKISYFMPINGYFTDRNFSGTGTSLSPVSYKVEGEVGSRILKIEMKNAGVLDEIENYLTSSLFLNFQVWIYEADETIEYRFGNHNITSAAALGEEVFVSGFVTEVFEGASNTTKLGYVTGNINAPVYNEAETEVSLTSGLSAMPTPNTVFRFTKEAVASVSHPEKVKFSVYPNPTSDVLVLTTENTEVKEYTLLDIKGRKVASGTIENPAETKIDIKDMANGLYLLKVGNTIQKIVKK